MNDIDGLTRMITCETNIFFYQNFLNNFAKLSEIFKFFFCYLRWHFTRWASSADPFSRNLSIRYLIVLSCGASVSKNLSGKRCPIKFVYLLVSPFQNTCRTILVIFGVEIQNKTIRLKNRTVFFRAPCRIIKIFL